MNLDQASELVRQALLVALLVSAPILLVGLIVGVISSLLQAVTHIQEQTLSFIPRIVAMAITTLLLIGWIGQRLIEYAREVFSPVW